MSDPVQLREVIRAQRYAQTQTGRTPVNATAGPREAILVPRFALPPILMTDRGIELQNRRWAAQWQQASPSIRRTFEISNVVPRPRRGQFPLAEHAATDAGYRDARGALVALSPTTPALARQQILSHAAVQFSDIVLRVREAARWAGPGGRLLILMFHAGTGLDRYGRPHFHFHLAPTIPDPTQLPTDPEAHGIPRLDVNDYLVRYAQPGQAAHSGTNQIGGRLPSQQHSDQTAVQTYADHLHPTAVHTLSSPNRDLATLFGNAHHAAEWVARYDAFEQIGRALEPLAEILILSCNAAGFPALIDELRVVWRSRLIAAPQDRVATNTFPPRPRLRLYFFSDAENQQSNTVRGETEPPELTHPRWYISR